MISLEFFKIHMLFVQRFY